MTPRPRSLLLAAVLLLGLVACSDMADRVDSLRASSQEMTESVRFCLSLARAATAVEAGSPDTAADAADEVLVHAPAEVRDDARTIVDGVRRSQESGERPLDDPDVRAALERVRDRTRELCDPTG